MAKYLDLNGVKRLVGQLWAKVKTLAAGKELHDTQLRERLLRKS